MGGVSFIGTMDHTSLSKITQEEFERKVEEAIQTPPPSPMRTRSSSSSDSPPAETEPEPPKMPSAPHRVGEEAARPLQLPTPASIARDTRKFSSAPQTSRSRRSPNHSTRLDGYSAMHSILLRTIDESGATLIRQRNIRSISSTSILVRMRIAHPREQGRTRHRPSRHRTNLACDLFLRRVHPLHPVRARPSPLRVCSSSPAEGAHSSNPISSGRYLPG